MSSLSSLFSSSRSPIHSRGALTRRFGGTTTKMSSMVDPRCSIAPRNFECLDGIRTLAESGRYKCCFYKSSSRQQMQKRRLDLLLLFAAVEMTSLLICPTFCGDIIARISCKNPVFLQFALWILNFSFDFVVHCYNVQAYELLDEVMLLPQNLRINFSLKQMRKLSFGASTFGARNYNIINSCLVKYDRLGS